MTRRRLALRFAIVLTVALGANYVIWRWLESVNWAAWWIAVPLVLAEMYSFVDVAFFGMTMWRATDRVAPPPPSDDTTVDVFVTTYDEPVDLVMRTALAAQAISFPHRTWVLDDGARASLAAQVKAAGIGYLVRTEAWAGRPQHAKAGNLNNALLATTGEFVLVLDADQVPEPAILDRTLGYFADERVALVQTPQHFSNVPLADPLGSQAPLFYGPIQRGKDGWDAAFYCGSNAVLRRDALMQLGLVTYVRETERSVRLALRTAGSVLARSRRGTTDPRVVRALDEVGAAVDDAVRRLDAHDPMSEVTFDFQRRVEAISASMAGPVEAAVRADLDVIAALPVTADEVGQAVVHERSPLGARSVRAIVGAVDVHRGHEAQAVMPVATASVTEDMATSMGLHALGWRTVYHHERLANGLAPEDLGTMITQRLRWAQGTLQVMLREKPLRMRGLRVGQRLMYFATMWSYLSGFAAMVYLAAPVIFLCSGILPVTAWSGDFFARFLPFQLASQVLFVTAAHGLRTWRGQQYSLALFPIWIKASVTAAANVWWGWPLRFAVTPKTRQEATASWRLVMPQLTAIAVLVIAAVVGLVRFGLGYAPWVGTFVNLGWVAYDLVMLSVIVRALQYRGYTGSEGARA